jgi:PAS domain S-box-containing protein
MIGQHTKRKATAANARPESSNRVATFVSPGEELARQLIRFQKFALDQAAIVAMTDVRGKIIEVNDKFCQISKYSREELIGQDHRIVNSGTHPKQFFRQMYATIGRGKVWHGEIRNRAKDGSFYWVETTIVPIIHDPAVGTINGYIVIRQDITELKKTQESQRAAKERAEAANQAKGEFLANMSHEIRTPMTAIIGYADLLCDDSRSQKERMDFVHTIRRNGEHLLSVINDILDVSKIEAGKLQVEKIAFDPAKIMAYVESSMRVRALEKGISFEVGYLGQIPRMITSDPTRLRQILLNLVNNAIKFTIEGGIRITVSYDAPSRKLRFAIADTGIGLSPEQQHGLFQPFSQADASTTRRFGGTGLGLVLCKRLIELMGGSITVQSEVGKGSRFEFSIEDSAAAESQDAAPAANKQNAQRSQKPLDGKLCGRVLLVEDGADNRRLVSIYLETAGLQVETATDGAVALRMISAARDNGQQYDAVLMDMQMPVMDGYTATREVRKRGMKDLPIIAFTAHALSSEKQKCLDCGCNDYATKPVNPDTLIETLAKYIQPSGKDPMKQQTNNTLSQPAPAANSPVNSPVDRIIRTQFLSNPAVCRVLPEYVAGLPQQVQSIRDSLSRQDLVSTRRYVHQLRGSGGAYGFPDITRLATAAESAIEAKSSADEIAARVEELLELVQRVEGFEEAKKAHVELPEMAVATV